METTNPRASIIRTEMIRAIDFRLVNRKQKFNYCVVMQGYFEWTETDGHGVWHGREWRDIPTVMDFGSSDA